MAVRNKAARAARLSGSALTGFRKAYDRLAAANRLHSNEVERRNADIDRINTEADVKVADHFEAIEEHRVGIDKNVVVMSKLAEFLV